MTKKKSHEASVALRKLFSSQSDSVSLLQAIIKLHLKRQQEMKKEMKKLTATMQRLSRRKK